VTAVGALDLDDTLGGGADDFGENYPEDFGDGYGDDLGDDYGGDFGDDLLGNVKGRMDHLVAVLRNTLHEDYADASDEDLEEVLTDMLDMMGPAEGLNFSSAISSIGRSAGSLLSDPAVASIAKAALPMVGGAVGTAYGGPLGAAVGNRLGGLAAGAIPTRTPAPTAARPMAPTTVPVLPAPAATPVAVPAATPAAAAGSDAAKKALVYSRQPEFVQSLLAAALGQYGRQQVAGVPVAQMLGTLSQLLGQAAADADELAYQSGSAADAESESLDDEDIYEALLDADDLELADAYERWDVP
jgi:hypothetical protein